MEYIGHTPNPTTFKEFFSLTRSSLKTEISEIDNNAPIQLVLICVSFFLLILVGLKGPSTKKEKDGFSGRQNTEQKNRRLMTAVGHIPRHYHFPSLPMPVVVEGLTSVYSLKQEGVKVLDRWVKQNGPLFEIAILNGKAVAILDPSLMQKILGSADIHVLNKPNFIYHIIFREWFRDGLIASEVDQWSLHRKMVSGIVHYKALPRYLKMMNKHSKSLIQSLVSEYPKDDERLQGQLIYDVLYSHLVKIIAEIVLGSESSSGKESEDLYQHFKHWKELLIYRLFHPESLIPPIWWLNPKKKVYDNHVTQIKDYIYKDAERVRREVELEKQRESQGKGQQDSGTADGIKPFRSLIREMVDCGATEKEIYDQVGTFMTAGHDTTVAAMNFFMQHMADNPDVQAKCQQELDAVFDSKKKMDGNCGDNFDRDYLTMDDVSQLKYLERCILESLRITPTIPLFFRELSAPLEVDGFKFKSGTTFAFVPWALHRDPAVYPNPEKFDPDRFLPENVKKRHAFSFIPFSQGPRGCAGRKLAIMEMKVVCAWLLRHFDIHSSDKWQDVRILFELTIFLERNYNISLKRRRHI